MSAAKTIAELPDAIQWHEGMLLAPQHFQQLSARFEGLLAYHLLSALPFSWGVRRVKLDPKLLLDGVLRVTELEAIMPDGLLVKHRPGAGQCLELDLTPYRDALKRRPLLIHLAVPMSRHGASQAVDAMGRYESIEGEPTPDENTGETEIHIPRLRPRLSLIASKAPPPQTINMPLVEVADQNEVLGLTDYIAPTSTLNIEAPLREGSPLRELCESIAVRIREKALFMVEKMKGSAVLVERALQLESQRMIQSLVASLPYFEAQLYTEATHPHALYLSLQILSGQLAALSPGMIPPVAKAYDHRNLRATFKSLKDYLFAILDRLHETHRVVAFSLEQHRFSLSIEERWLRKRLVIGMHTRTGASEQALIEWAEGALIGSRNKIKSMREKRILGLEREWIEADEELLLAPQTGMVLFALKVDPEFVEPNELLQIFNPSDADGAAGPAEIVLYVKS
jgi:type VI secretion system protein ImpJ